MCRGIDPSVFAKKDSGVNPKFQGGSGSLGEPALHGYHQRLQRDQVSNMTSRPNEGICTVFETSLDVCAISSCVNSSGRILSRCFTNFTLFGCPDRQARW